MNKILQFIKFCGVGVVNTAVSTAAYWLCLYFGAYYLFANVIGFAIGTLTSYFLNNLFVFPNNEKTFVKLLKSVIVLAANLALSSGILYLCVHYIKMNEGIAVLPVLAVTTIFNFVVSKLWVYKNKRLANFGVEEMAEEPKVCIVIPAYNAASVIEKTIKSVLSQTYKNIDLTVIDDCSTDNTAEVVQSSYPDVKLIKNDVNLGHIGNFNKALTLAADSKYFKILCADDLLAPDFCKKMVNAFEKNPTAVLCFSASNVIDENDKILFYRGLDTSGAKFKGKLIGCWAFKQARNIFGETSTVLLRTDVIEKVGEFDIAFEKSTEDLDYWLRVLKFGDAIYLNEPLSFFRWHFFSITGHNSKDYNIFNIYHKKICDKHAKDYGVGCLLCAYSKLLYRFKNLAKFQIMKYFAKKNK